jgi:hypothetical protein
MTAAHEAGGADRPTGADHAFQEWFWLFQRFAWVALALFIAAALAGLTGRGGPLSRGTVQAGAARIDYPAISRWQTADHLTIDLPGETHGAEVLLPGSLLEGFAVEHVSPQPRAVIATPRGARYVFDVEAGGGMVTARFDLRAITPAVPAGTHRLGVNGTPAHLRLLVLP